MNRTAVKGNLVLGGAVLQRCIESLRLMRASAGCGKSRGAQEKGRARVYSCRQVAENRFALRRRRCAFGARGDFFPSRLAPEAALLISVALLLVFLGCSRQSTANHSLPKPTAYGAAIVESSGGKQTNAVGTQLPQPVVVQVNDEQGNAVTGALVVIRGPNGVFLDPSAGLTDSSGQFTSNVSLGTIPGRYQLTASTTTKAGKNVDLKIEEIGLGYQEILGSQLNDQYCARCHNQESTPQRVSNYDNLETKPHPFTEGDTLNKMSDADLIAIISHGGPALNKSPLMAPYGYTLSKSEIQALIAYIRMVSDPPYGAPGIVYAQK